MARSSLNLHALLVLCLTLGLCFQPVSGASQEVLLQTDLQTLKVGCLSGQQTVS